jgi:hypothetical protein
VQLFVFKFPNFDQIFLWGKMLLFTNAPLWAILDKTGRFFHKTSGRAARSVRSVPQPLETNKQLSSRSCNTSRILTDPIQLFLQTTNLVLADWILLRSIFLDNLGT